MDEEKHHRILLLDSYQFPFRFPSHYLIYIYNNEKRTYLSVFLLFEWVECSMFTKFNVKRSFKKSSVIIWIDKIVLPQVYSLQIKQHHISENSINYFKILCQLSYEHDISTKQSVFVTKQLCILFHRRYENFAFNLNNHKYYKYWSKFFSNKVYCWS